MAEHLTCQKMTRAAAISTVTPQLSITVGSQKERLKRHQLALYISMHPQNPCQYYIVGWLLEQMSEN